MLSYQAVWQRSEPVEDWVRPGTIVRLESPSDEPGLDALLLSLGGGHPPAKPTAVISSAAWAAGLRQLLQRVDAWLADAAPHRRTHHSDDILTMMDKHATWERLRAAGVPVADALPTAQRSWAELRAAASRRGWRQCIVKARHGSSAAGLLAVRWSGTRVIGVSTVSLLSDGSACNSRSLRRYRSATELDAVLGHIGEAHVEEWLPKLGAPNSNGGRARPFDFRIVVIGGTAQHLLVRIGQTPFTNLHLGAVRGDPTVVRGWLGEAAWSAVQQAAEAAVACFPTALFAGVDVGVVRPGAEPVVWEVNAFGDFHEGVEASGRDTYQAELAALGVQLPRSGAGPGPTWLGREPIGAGAR